MIYCPNCNTANRDNSKFCNECGTSLREANVRCQMCGNFNPHSLTHCTHCGARLVVQADAEPEELPEEDAPALAPSAATDYSAQAEMPPAFAASAEPASESDADAVSLATDSEVPAWLNAEPSAAQEEHALAEASPSAPDEPPEAPADEEMLLTPTPEVEMPEWLRALRREQADVVSHAAEEAPTPDTPFRVPDAPTASELMPPAEASAEPATAEPAAELPDWLKGFHAEDAPPGSVPEVPAQTAAPETSDVPNWLADLHSTTTPSGEADTPFAASESADEAEPAGELQPGDVPDWLRGIMPAPTDEQPADWSLDDVAVEQLPDWLKPTGAPTPATASGTPQPAAGALAPGEIPAWLQALKPGAAESMAGEAIETSGLLAGIRGALPVESVVTLPHHSEPIESAQAAVPVAGFAELFAPQPPAPQSIGGRPVRPSSFMSGRAILIVLIFAVAALPFLPLFAEIRGSNVTRHQPSLDFYQTVEALRPNQLVMVAIDYSGGSRAELDPQARAALLHLFQNKQHIVALSFVPDGAQLAQDLLTGLNPTSTAFPYPYVYGDTHVNLGYQSDGDAALRALATNPAAMFRSDYRGQSLSNAPLAKDLKSLGDFALLIVISDDATQVKRWVEQVAQPSARPLVVGVSAAAAPAVMPYYNSKQINGLLEGVRGAAEYEVSLARPSSAAASLDAISYVAIVLVVVIVLVVLATLLFRRRRAASAS